MPSSMYSYKWTIELQDKTAHKLCTHQPWDTLALPLYWEGGGGLHRINIQCPIPLLKVTNVGFVGAGTMASCYFTLLATELFFELKALNSLQNIVFVCDL